MWYVCPNKDEVHNGGISESKKGSSYACDNCCRILDILQWLSALRQHIARWPILIVKYQSLCTIESIVAFLLILACRQESVPISTIYVYELQQALVHKLINSQKYLVPSSSPDLGCYAILKMCHRHLCPVGWIVIAWSWLNEVTLLPGMIKRSFI